MDDIITIAKERAEKFEVGNIIVATNTGATATLVHQAFGSGYRVYAVGNPAAAHTKRLVGHSGISETTQKNLEAIGIRVVLKTQSLFQAMERGGAKYDIGANFDIWGHTFKVAHLDEVIEKTCSKGQFNAVSIIFNTLQLFGESLRVCIEVTMMAADSGQLPLDKDCLAISRPSDISNCPHAAVVMRPSRTMDIFMGNLRIKDVTLVPGPKDHWFNNKPLWVG